MQKTEQVFITNTRRRESVDSLAGLAKRLDQSTQDAGVTILPGSFGDICEDHCLPECETYRITDLDAIIDSLGDEWGNVVGEQLVPDSGIASAITVQADLDRVTDTRFKLPSAAQWVVDVWFDDLHADPGYHYTYEPDRYIVTKTSLPTDIVVAAVYFSKVTA